jgi:hypothetical protein
MALRDTSTCRNLTIKDTVLTRTSTVIVGITVLLGAFKLGNPQLTQAQQESYGVGTWDRSTLGNHRAVVEVSDSTATAAHARITWRRRDDNPQNKKIIVVDAKTGDRIDNVHRREVN